MSESKGMNGIVEKVDFQREKRKTFFSRTFLIFCYFASFVSWSIEHDCKYCVFSVVRNSGYLINIQSFFVTVDYLFLVCSQKHNEGNKQRFFSTSHIFGLKKGKPIQYYLYIQKRDQCWQCLENMSRKNKKGKNMIGK